MNKTVLIFLLIELINSLNTQNIAKNYFVNHDDMNMAEEFFSNENKIGISLFNDHSFNYKGNMISCCEGYKLEGFYFNSFGYSTNPMDNQKSNELRKTIHMCSYELDLKKKEFEKKWL